jgi:sugar-specific transcriptional regulator TrmB
MDLEFKELGLTTNETKVYEVLLRLGKSTAGRICKEAEVPYGRIYTVLASLEEKSLIKTIPEATKSYVPVDPQKLREIIDNKIKNLMEIDNKVKELKKIYEEHPTEPIIVAKGKNNFDKIIKEMKEPTKYSYSIKYMFTTRPELVRKTRDEVKKGIDIKVLGRFDSETEGYIKEWKVINKEIKPIENEGIAISMIDDEEISIRLSSHVSMLIRDKAFVKLMRILFVKYYTNTDYEKE